MNLNTAEEIIQYIKNAKRRTDVTVYANGQIKENYEEISIYQNESFVILKGNYEDVKKVLDKEVLNNVIIESNYRNSAIKLLNTLNIKARIEPGSIIRDHVFIGEDSVIMMGAVINIGAVIGSKTMIDMNVVIGGRAIIGESCHIGAGTVVAGVIEPISAQPVKIGNNVVIGANAVVLEGIQIGDGAVIGAGCIVTKDVEPYTVVVGNPGRVVKVVDEKTKMKTEIIEDLR